MIIPVWGRQRVGELAVLVHKPELVPHQIEDKDQPHLQLGDLHPSARVSASSPADKWVDGVRNWVRSQPPTQIIFIQLRVVFGVQVNISNGIQEETISSDHPFTGLPLLIMVPSDGYARHGNLL